MEAPMPIHIRLAALAAGAILSSSMLAQAQGINAAGGQVGPSGVIMSPGAMPAPSAPPATTGASQTGVPNSTTPGRVGGGASPSGLPGDNPSAPGFPGKVGR
jgi:hypothetical protein